MDVSLAAAKRLIFSGRAWQRLRPMLVEDGRFATAPVRWRLDGREQELLIDDLTVSDELPRGAARPPLEDWAAVLVDHGQRLTPRQWIEQIAPKRSHRLLVAILQAGEPARCHALLSDNGTLAPIDEVRVNGGGMLWLDRGGTSAEACRADHEARWSRTVGVVGETVMRRLRNTTVTIVGAGRLGSRIAFDMAALGVSRIRLIDGDRLLPENLDAMPGLTAADVGQPKAAALAERLCEFRPDLTVSFVASPINDPAARKLLLRRCDLLVTCVDNDTARLAAALVARQTLTVHLDVGTSIQRTASGELTMTGDVRLLCPGEGCLACVGGLDDPDRRWYEVAAPPGALQLGPPSRWDQQRAGSLISLNSITAGIAVQSWLALCANQYHSSHWHRLAWSAETGLRDDHGAVVASPSCRICSGGAR